MAVHIGHHTEHHVYLFGIHHRPSVEAGVLLGVGTVCSKDEAGALEQDSASRLSMSCNVPYDAVSYRSGGKVYYLLGEGERAKPEARAGISWEPAPPRGAHSPGGGAGP
jgi:hypothetical protein